MAEDALARARAIAARLNAQSSGSDVLGKRGRDDDSNWNWGNGGGASGGKKQKVFIPVDKYPDINFLGLLIGPRGSNQKRMEESSGARILIRGKGSSKDPGDPSENEDLHVLISADTDEQIEKAQKLVEDIIFNPEQAMQLKREQLQKVAELKGAIDGGGGGGMSGGGGGGGGGGHYGPGISAESNSMFEYEVPTPAVGYIIGRGGETIRELQMKSGAHIQIVRQSEANPHATTRMVGISGSDENIAKAKMLIKNLLEERQNGGRGRGGDRDRGGGGGGMGGDPNDDSETMQIPNSKTGLIIGRGGSNIKSIQDRTGTNINIPSVADSSNPSFRTINISGPRDGVEAAKREISLIIDEDDGDAPPGGSALYVQIPDDSCGLIIGRGGETVKGIQNRTRTRIQVPNVSDPGTNPPVRTISITGIGNGPEMAKYEIECLVSGQGQGQTGGGGYDNYGGAYHQQQQQQPQQMQQMQQQQQQQQQTTYSDPNDPNAYWNGYYEYAAYYGVEAANAAWGVAAVAPTSTDAAATATAASVSTASASTASPGLMPPATDGSQPGQQAYDAAAYQQYYAQYYAQQQQQQQQPQQPSTVSSQDSSAGTLPSSSNAAHPPGM